MLTLFVAWHSSHCLCMACCVSPSRHQLHSASSSLLSAVYAHISFPNIQMCPVTAVVTSCTKGLLFVYFTAQPEPSLPLEPRDTLNVYRKR